MSIKEVTSEEIKAVLKEYLNAKYGNQKKELTIAVTAVCEKMAEDEDQMYMGLITDMLKHGIETNNTMIEAMTVTTMAALNCGIVIGITLVEERFKQHDRTDKRTIG